MEGCDHEVLMREGDKSEKEGMDVGREIEVEVRWWR